MMADHLLLSFALRPRDYRIHDQLLHSLHAHPSNWPTTLQNHALNLLRSGEVSSFPALLRRVMEDVRQDAALAPAANGTAVETNGKKTGANGASSAAGKDGSVNGTSAVATTAAQSLAVPQSVVEDALRVTRDCLDIVCEIDDSGTA